MKKIFKPTLAFLLAFVMIFGTAPLAGFVELDLNWPGRLNFDWLKVEASAYSEGIYTYEVASGKATITDCDNSASGAISIPSTLGGYPVTSIGDWAFEGCTGLTSVIIPDSVTSIGEYAYYGCYGLTSVTIPDSLTSIGGGAFGDCSGLTAITVGSGNTAYESIDGVLFNKAKTILILVPGGKEGAYSIPNSVTSIGGSAFYSCTGLTSVTIPDSVTSIGESAFCVCYGLTSVIIPDSVTSIGEYAFYGCYGLTSVTIPDFVMSIGDRAFGDCSGLTAITVGQGNTAYASIDGVLFNKEKTILIQVPGGKEGAYSIPNFVASIGESAFYGCTGLTSVTIPDSVTSIGESAFCVCYHLTSVIIPDSVTSIGDKTFYYCTGLTSVTIPDSVTSIGGYAFYGCSGLTGVTIPDSVTSIGDEAFNGCINLTIFGVPGSYAEIYANDNGINFSPLEEDAMAADPDSGCVIDSGTGTIYGLEPGITKEQFESSFVNVSSGYSLQYSVEAIGTGTVVNVIDSGTGEVVETYTLILFGDVNGDSVINAVDFDICSLVQNWMIEWDETEDAAFIKAADVNGDGRVDAVDADIISLHENWLVTIDQATGLAG